jgi:hypothetical protein
MNEIAMMAQTAVVAKNKILDKGLYTPIPHELLRIKLPELRNKYDGPTARDSLVLFLFLSSYVNGNADNSFYMWAFPSVKQISDDTGIHKDRLKKLCLILESEGLLKTVRIPYNGHTKKLFLPIL